VFASLGIADLLQQGSKTADELAVLVGTNARTLYRLLRFLSTLDVLREQDDGGFALTPLGGTLRRGGLPVVRDNTLLVGSAFYWKALGGLLDHVVTGKNPSLDQSFFEHLRGHPRDAAVFDAAMDSLSKVTVPAILLEYDFSVFRRIVDVGGGRGSLLSAILRRYPSICGVLYDAPNVINAGVVDEAIAGRLERIAGSFFESVPSGGDAYILRQILHDWNDEHATKILMQCRKAISDSGRLLIIETAAPSSKNSGNNWAALDLLMMVLTDGLERTLSEFENLLRKTSFSIQRVVSTASPLSIIEASPT
jgi:hypothetical protein